MGKLLGYLSYNISIKTKLIVLFAIVFLYPLLLIAVFGFGNFGNTIQEKFIYYAERDVDFMSNQVIEQLEIFERFSQDLLYDEGLYEKGSIKKLKEIYGADALEKYEFGRDFEAYLRAIVRSRPEMDLMVVKYKEEIIPPLGATKSLQSIDMSSIPIEEIVTLSYKFEGVFYYTQKNDGRVTNVYLARAMYDRNTFKKTGVVIMRVDREYIFRNVKDFFNDPVYQVFVSTDEYDEVWSMNLRDAILEEEIISLMNVKQLEGTYLLGKKSGQKYTIIRKMKSLNWRFAVVISPEPLISDTRSLSLKILILCICTVPVFLFFVNLFYKDIIRPIYTLVKKMQQLEEGAIGITMKSKRRDELGYLFQTFDKMSYQIKYLINQVYKEEIALRNAEIKALQSQINPHFLYNTLETINWKSRLSGNHEISEMVTALAEITEVNIDRKNDRFIFVRDEIHYLENYILLIQKRFGDKIRFEKVFEKGVLDLKIPKITIQPLIENAIYHGIEPAGRGTVCLYMEAKQECLIIKVQDDGVGIEKELLKKIQQSLDEKVIHDIKGKVFEDSKIGLLNVHRRIRLICGDEYGLTIESEYCHGTLIQMTLPIDIEYAAKLGN